MAYSDILNAVQLYGDVLGKTEEDYMNEEGINPYGSRAYVDRSFRNVASEFSPVVDPRSIYSEYTPGFEERFGGGAQGLGMGSGLHTGLTKAFPGVGSKFGGFGLPLAGGLYGATRDFDPYKVSKWENIGNIGTGALASASMMPYLARGAASLGAGTLGTTAASGLAGTLGATTGGAGLAGLLGGPIGMIAIPLLLGGLFGRSRKRAAAKANREAEEQLAKEQAEQQEQKEEKFHEAREDFLSEQQGALWEQEASKYDNQYGGYANPGTTTYRGEKGMKFNPKELAKYGRNGDTIVAHINPQEAQLLKSLGGSGTINPYTGLPEFGLFDVFGDIIGGIGELLTGAIGSIPEAIGGMVEGIVDTGRDVIGLFTGGSELPAVDRKTQHPEITRATRVPIEIPELGPVTQGRTEYAGPINLDNDPAGDAMAADLESWRWDLDNPYIEENVDVFNQGGVNKNSVAELTGDELVVNNQDIVEEGLNTNNYQMAAAPIRDAINKGYITPGKTTHKKNPLQVNNRGIIFDEGGALPFKIVKGAGVYDHASKQFNPKMTDKEIAMIAKKNIAKWEKNNMA